MKRYLQILGMSLLLVLVQAGSAYAVQNHTVKTGDTLWDIANYYGVSVASIQQSNRLTSDRLQIGMKLVINSSAPNNTAKTQIADAGNIYVVQSGDNLWTIARSFNMSVEQLMKINNLSSDRLDVGDKINVKRPAAAATPSRALYPKTVSPTPPVPEATEGDSNQGATICQTGAKYLGTPYRYGGSSPSGFDCSGFVGFVFQQHGYNLPRTAASISGVGVAIDKSNLREGDLVFFKGPGASCINHVGIFAGNNQFIHSSSGKARGVTYSSLDGPYYSQYYAGARRILPE